jgi:hypothetical protein
MISPSLVAFYFFYWQLPNRPATKNYDFTLFGCFYLLSAGRYLTGRPPDMMISPSLVAFFFFY